MTRAVTMMSWSMTPRAYSPRKPVRFWLRSKDVLHNFTVAQFRVKMDAVPGMESFMWLEPTKVGEYEICSAKSCVGSRITRCAAG